MASTINGPADVVNLVLVRIGSKWLIGNIYDGSEPAQLALAIYGQTRDEMLRSLQPGFAQRQVALTLLKTAPPDYVVTPWTSDFPLLPWSFEYSYPDDCIRLGSVRFTPPFIPNFDPQPNNYGIANDDALDPPQKVILCDVPGPIMTYTAQVTNPALWEPSFLESLAAELGRRLAPALANLETAKAEAGDGQAQSQTDKMIQG